MREKVARNFVKRYGLGVFRRLVTGLEEQRSGQELARELGVSRQRINQWKSAFGSSVTLYLPTREVKRLLGRERRE